MFAQLFPTYYIKKHKKKEEFRKLFEFLQTE